MLLTEKVLDRFARMRLLDDGFMKKVFEDKACTELLLRIILDKPDLTVTMVETEFSLKNLQGRGARLDVYASDSQGKQYNIEVQRENDGATPKRARYNSSLLDANITEPGDNYQQLPENYVIFITEHDVLHQNEQLYWFDRICRKTSRALGDGSHIIYVNAARYTDTALGRLMQDFTCTRPGDMHYDILAERVRYFKEDKEGMNIMCKIWEEFVEDGIEQGLEQGKIQTARRLIVGGKLTMEEIADASQIPLSKVLELAEEVKVGQ